MIILDVVELGNMWGRYDIYNGRRNELVFFMRRQISSCSVFSLLQLNNNYAGHAINRKKTCEEEITSCTMEKTTISCMQSVCPFHVEKTTFFLFFSILYNSTIIFRGILELGKIKRWLVVQWKKWQSFGCKELALLNYEEMTNFFVFFSPLQLSNSHMWHL